MKKWLFINEAGVCTQSDDDAVMGQQAGDENTCVVNTETGEYRYGDGNASNQFELIQEQELYSGNDIKEEEL